VVPAIGAPAVQREILRPVERMLELEGWHLSASNVVAFDAVKADLRMTLAVRPALRAAESDPDGWSNAVVLSEYEVRKDLPSCLLKMP
jgi:hypothetical protein